MNKFAINEPTTAILVEHFTNRLPRCRDWAWRGVFRPLIHARVMCLRLFLISGGGTGIQVGGLLKELGTSRTHSAVIRCLIICQHIPIVRKNHKNQLTQQFDIICCLARCLALCIESKQIMSLLSCESTTLKRGPQLCGQRCGPYQRFKDDSKDSKMIYLHECSLMIQ